jgi:putative endopeptidase
MKSLVLRARLIVSLAITLGSLNLGAQESHGVNLTIRDTSCAPCQAFYEYANGGWIRAQPMPSGNAAHGAIEELGMLSSQRQRGILETLRVDKERAGSSAWKLATFYASCMDTTAIRSAGTAPFQPELKRIAAIKDRRDLAREIARLHRVRIPVAFTLHAQPDHKAGEVAASIGTAGVGLEADEYTSDDSSARAHRSGYTDHVAHILGIAGVQAPVVDSRTRDELELERQLATRSPMNMDAPAMPMASVLSIAVLQQRYPALVWTDYFAAVSAPSNSPVIVGDSAALAAATRALETASLQSWKDYLTVRYLEQGMAESFGDGVDRDFQVRGDREMACVDEAQTQLGWILGRLYVEREFTPAARARVDTMVQNIRAVLRDDLERLPWMSAPTRSEALKKLDAFSIELGYPDRWPDFSVVDVGRRPFWTNALATKAYRTRLELARIGKAPSRDDWWQGYWPQTSDGYFNPDLNEIVIAAGYIQQPMFDVHADDASNYGGIGAVIGHEMTHAFDGNGREYDASGKLRNWWTASDRATYDSLASKVARQFGEFVVVDTVHVNGRQTLNEDLADIGGLKLAYLALERALAGKPRTAIGGLSPEQRFFLAYAQSRRGVFGSGYLRDVVRENAHAPDKWRVLGPLMNMPEFANAFRCRPGDALVRGAGERVTLW